MFPFYYAHTIASFLAFAAIIAAQFFTWYALGNSKTAGWGAYRRYSLVSGIVSVFFLLVFLLTLTSAYQGATERLFAAVPLIWLEISGIKLYLISK